MSRFTYVLVAVLLVSFAACSSNDSKPSADTTPAAVKSSSTPSTAPDPTVALRKAVQSYSDAYLTGDGKAAYALLSARCQKRNTLADFSQIASAAGDMYGSALPIKTFDAQVSGGLARVTYTYDVSAINQDAEPWVLEGGSWHEDDC